MPRKENESHLGSLFFMDDKALTAISNYLDDSHVNKDCLYFRKKFDHDSYLTWAASELASRILDSPHESSFTIVEEFMYEMAMYAFMATEEHSLIFQTAVELSEKILEVLN